MNITFVGNCQMISLCFFFQELLRKKEYNIAWVLFDPSNLSFLGKWSVKCLNKILDCDIAIERIKESDIIIYQEIVKEKSAYCNTETLRTLIKETCILIKIPSFYFKYENYDESMKELQMREDKNNVDIKVSTIIERFKEQNLMLTYNHPTTHLFLEVMREICLLLNIEFFTKEQLDNYMKNNNIMELHT